MIAGIATFIVVFILTSAYMTSVYGYDFNMTSGPYAQVMNVTMDAAQKTEGMSIDLYIAQVKSSICETLPDANQTAIDACYAI